MYKINHADILDWAKNYDGEPFDGILCDPPYELGFMGKSWDSTGIAFNVELWTELLKICKPGAHLLAFSGSRTYHRMACAIEDAGFEIRDMIEWVYGSGFPKSLNIGKAVDKLQGNEREVIGKSRNGSNSLMGGLSNTITTTEQDVTKGTSEWEGYGTALKPAHEPCVLARKPIKGTVANNCLEYGTGGLNIDGSRIGTEQIAVNRHEGQSNSLVESTKGKWTGKQKIITNRFPANLIHDNSDKILEIFPNTKSGNLNAGHKQDAGMFGKIGGDEITGNYGGDSGSAARFFYTAKASKSERNAGLDVLNTHPTVKPLALTKYLANLIKPPKGGRLLVPFSGSGSEMIGALQAGWEYVEGVELTEEYIPIAEARIKYWLDKIDKQLEML